MTTLINWIYVYCTDFIINVANLLDSSYYEINFIVFCLIYPILLVGLILVYWTQKRRLKKLKYALNQ